MNPSDSQDGDDGDDHCRAVELQITAARLDVYGHERLDYTALPQGNDSTRRASKRRSLLRAMYHWVHSR